MLLPSAIGCCRRRSSGSPRKWPPARWQRARMKLGPPPARARPIPAPAALRIASTSLPSTRETGIPNERARFVTEPAVTAFERVVIAKPLSLHTNRTGSLQTAARFSDSSNIPWLIAPSPKNATATPPGRRPWAARAKPQPNGPAGADDARRGGETLLVEQVHVTATPAAQASLATEHLSHDRREARAPRDERRCGPVINSQRITIVHVRQNPRDHRFLTDPQMQLPRDQASLPELAELHLHAAHTRHLQVQLLTRLTAIAGRRQETNHRDPQL